MEFLSQYELLDLFCIGLSLFLTGMNKGGFPVGSIALPLLILMWPAQAQAARSAVGFMLPMLCLMDVIAFLSYRRYVLWKRIVYMMPAALFGIAIASFLFVSDSAMISVSDRALKILIGVLGITFVIYFAAKKWILHHIKVSQPNWVKGSVFGAAAGITSTLAHAAGPVVQMYLLPQQLEKKNFAGTNAAFFWILNLVKLVPFIMLGRIHTEGLKLGGILLPTIPLGVWAGWWLTQKTEQRHYIALIYVVLLITSIILIAKAF